MVKIKGYICPTCNNKFFSKEDMKKHSLSCWREHNPNHITKHAPQGETVNRRNINNDVQNFFDSFLKGISNDC